MYMKVQRSVFCSMVLIFEFLLILMGCGGGGCPTVSRTGSSSSSGTGGTRTSSNVCGTSNGNGSGSGINGQCTGKLSPTEVLYSFDIPTNSTNVANILPFAIGSNGALTLMCGNASANIGQLALIGNKFLYAFDPTSATIAGFSIAHGNSGALTAIPASPFTISDTFTGFSSTNFPRIEADPLGRFLFITNFAGGQIDIFQVDQASGALTVAPSSPVHVLSPIHLVVEPSGKFVYVPDSQNARITIYSIDSAGNMTLTNVFSIPTGSIPGTDAPLFIEAHPNGKFLFTANRGSVAAYVIDLTTGNLSYAPGSPFNTASLQIAPLLLTLDATAKFLYVADTGNNGIPGFTVDGTTGALALINGSPFTGPSVSDLVPNPAGPQLYVHIGTSINVYSIDATSGALTPPTTQAQFFTASNLVIANVQ
jgi:6-phosphogluconolactonase (cycloisomerase 2 family)